jgi:transcription initiation factor IIE alpha subunit
VSVCVCVFVSVGGTVDTTLSHTYGSGGAAVMLAGAAGEHARAEDKGRARITDFDTRAVRQLLQKLQEAHLIVCPPLCGCVSE